jgi:hypothetical protein
MRTLSLTLLGATAALALLATNVSAAIVCNAEGDCWKAKEKHKYPPHANVTIYDDDYVIDTKKYRWREARPGPGFWRGGVWIDF